MIRPEEVDGPFEQVSQPFLAGSLFVVLFPPENFFQHFLKNPLDRGEGFFMIELDHKTSAAPLGADP